MAYLVIPLTGKSGMSLVWVKGSLLDFHCYLIVDGHANEYVWCGFKVWLKGKGSDTDLSYSLRRDGVEV